MTTPLLKWQMSCCAMCQFTASNDTPLSEIKAGIEQLKKESKLEWQPTNRDSGERAIQMVTTPYEVELEEKVKKLGFKHIATFNRRNGYPQVGQLKLWFLYW